MVRLLAVSGASEADTARLRELLPQASARLDAAWQIADRADAGGLLVIDVDSVYGHMDWLRAQSSGRPVAVLTEQTRFDEAELVLHKPVALDNLVDVLGRASARVSARPAPSPTAAPRPMPDASSVQPPSPRERRLLDWLRDGSLTTPTRVQCDEAPELILDPETQTYFAEGALRALAPYCVATIAREQCRALAQDEIERCRTSGKGQPFARLLWLCQLLGSHGKLDPALDGNARFRLRRWPQIEREFPKHFRIATVMMKQAATLAEIAEQSGAGLAEVIDFINAYHAIGHIDTESAAAEVSSRDSGRVAILSRLRNPFGGS
jgi:hypothetical protein